MWRLPVSILSLIILFSFSGVREASALELKFLDYPDRYSMGEPGYFSIFLDPIQEKTLSDVTFYLDGQLHSVVTARPFSAIFTDLSAGKYRVKIVARDKKNNSYTAEKILNVFRVSGRTIRVAPLTAKEGELSASNLQEAADMSEAGDRIFVGPGTYEGRLHISRSGTAQKPITWIATARHKSILTNPGNPRIISHEIGAHYNRFQGFLLTGRYGFSREPAIDMAKGWMLLDSKLSHVGQGIDFNIGATGSDIAGDGANGVRIIRTVVENAYHNSIEASGRWTDAIQNFEGPTDTIVSDVILRRGNEGAIDPENPESIIHDGAFNHPGFGTASMKILMSDQFTFDRLVSYDHIGAGFWFDFKNKNTVLSHLSSFGNKGVYDRNPNRPECNPEFEDKMEGSGGFYEISPGPVRIEDSTFWSLTGFGLHLMESSNITVQRNLFYGESIHIRDNSRETPKSIFMTRNKFKKSDYGLVAEGSSRNKHWRYGEEMSNYNFFSDFNTFDSVKGLISFLGKICLDTESCQKTDFNFSELHSKEKSVGFPYRRYKVHSVRISDPNPWQVPASSESITLEDVIAKTKINAAVRIPVFGAKPAWQRGNIWMTDAFDLQGNRVRVIFSSTAKMKEFDGLIPQATSMDPKYIEVKLTSKNEYKYQVRY